MKKELRKQLIEKRKGLSISEVEITSKHIMNRIKSYFNLDEIQVIALYYPFNQEVDVLPLIEYLLKQNKIVVLPKVTSKTTMSFYKIDSLNDVSRSQFGVYEPNTNQVVTKDDIEIMFIPGVGFNSKGYRLGYGAGYYDRYLIDHAFNTVGVCFDFQITDEFEIAAHDIPLDFVISENRLLQCHNEDDLPNQNMDK
jgi:5-formyltetrahydrofolate cyclo-ligase